MAYITINQAHYYHNLDLLCGKAGGKDKVMAVLKDNAYGHGLELMANLTSTYGLQKAAVKNLQEAHLINHLFDEVLILADHPPTQAVSPNISFAAHAFETLLLFPKGTAIHLSIDTGMHRNGVREDKIEAAILRIKERGLNLKGIFTHFRSSDELNSEFFWQHANFEHAKVLVKELLKKHGLPSIAFHSCNSAGLLRKQSLGSDDFARCGIAMYGYTTLHPMIETPALKPVLSLWAQKLSTRIIKQGERVGYGGIYEATCDEVISTYDIGYGDGFFRFDGHGELFLANQQTIKGRMSMDSFCTGGDAQEICMFEDATALAKHFRTISYEIITKLSPTLKRVVI